MSGRGRCRSTTKAREAAGRCGPRRARRRSSGHLPRCRGWNETALEALCRARAEAAGIGFGKFAQPLRVALTGAHGVAGRLRDHAGARTGRGGGARGGRGDRTQSLHCRKPIEAELADI